MQHVLYGRICYEFVRTYHFDYKCCGKEDYGDRGLRARAEHVDLM